MSNSVKITLALLLAAGPVAAQDWTYVSSYGDEYSIAKNDNGVVLRSLYPKAWFIEGGANSRVVKGIDVLYFGKSCDAFHDEFGKGRWWWINGGFGADFDNFKISFPRQEIDVPNSMDCQLEVNIKD